MHRYTHLTSLPNALLKSSMSVYLLLSTHLPTLEKSLQHVIKSAPDILPARILIPAAAQFSEPAPWGDDCHPIRYEGSVNAEMLDESSAHTTFVVLDPMQDLPEQLESLAADLDSSGCELARVITLVDCTAAESSGPLREYLEACIFCSDLVLLGNRSAASPKFVTDFQKSYARKCFPCRFIILKESGAFSPVAEFLIPEARRLTKVFDPVGPEEDVVPLAAIEIDASFDLDAEEDSDLEDIPAIPDLAEGRRLPDVSAFCVGFSSTDNF